MNTEIKKVPGTANTQDITTAANGCEYETNSVYHNNSVNSRQHFTESQAISYLISNFNAPLDALDKLIKKQELSAFDILDAACSLADRGETAESIWADYVEKDEDPTNTLLGKYDFDSDFWTVPGLTEEEKKPTEFIIDDIIPVGLTFLCGPPKARKSFIVLQMAMAVASGTDFLKFKTKQCDVVYFDLEGSKSRTWQRTKNLTIPNNLKIRNDTKIGNQDYALTIAPKDDRLTLTEYIQLMHRAKPNTRLFIIDTYSKARGNPRTYGANAYDVDVELLGPLHDMAIAEQIAVVCVHHTKKGASKEADVFEQASGTMGITGSSDSYICLTPTDFDRASGKAKLDYNPRDAEGGTLSLEFNSVLTQWQISQDNDVDYMGNPLYAFCVNHRPEENGTVGTFYSYEQMYRESYGASIEQPGNEIQKKLHGNKDMMLSLYSDHKVAVQFKARNGKEGRGIRLIAV